MKNKGLKIKYLNNALLIDDILVIGDLHIGFEEVLGGGMVRIQVNEMIKKLREIFDYLKGKKKISKVIICGDLKHEFGRISEAEWRDTLKVLDFLLERVAEVILIKGNHDNILGPIVRKRNVKLKGHHKYKGVLFIHGNKKPDKKILNGVEMMIMGHLHPSIILNDKYKKEKYKCFLEGVVEKKKIIILPSFSDITIGYEVNFWDKGQGKENFMFISDKNLGQLNVIIYNNKEKKRYDFGILKNLNLFRGR